MFVIAVLSLWFLCTCGTARPDFEHVRETQRLTVYQQLASKSIYEYFDKKSNDGNRNMYLTAEASTIHSSASFKPSHSKVDPSECSTPAAIPLLSEDLPSESKMFGNESGFWLQYKILQTNVQQLPFGTVMFPTSTQDLFSDSGVLFTSTNSLYLHTGFLQTSEEGSISNADVPQNEGEGLIPATDKFVASLNDFSFSTIAFESSTWDLPLEKGDGLITDNVHETFLATHQYSDMSNIGLPVSPAYEETYMTVTKTDTCCTSASISPSRTLSSVPSSTVHFTPNNSGVDNEEIQHLAKAQRLTIVQLNEHAGFITSPGFGSTHKYPPNINDTHCFLLSPPTGGTLLLSFPQFYLENSRTCRYDYLRLVVGNANNRTEIWKKCGSQTIAAEILTESVACLHFKTDYSVEKKGFNATYSILPRPAEDYALGDGVVNCSALGSYHRALHFDCNIALDCDDHQDEMNCSYSSEHCPGQLDVGDKCYTSRLRSKMTWSAANKACLNLNKNLISPQGLQEWDTFMKSIEHVNRSVSIYLGLQSKGYSSAISSIYRSTWKWSTETTAFYLKYPMRMHYTSHPACALYNPDIENNTILIISCFQALDILLICERKKKIRLQSPELLPLLSLQNSSYEFPITTVQCPAGHLVQNYLECDFESHCHEDLSQGECLQQSTEPVPELFSCLVSTTYSVHYTLLCDHRVDCPDASDESFCVYHKCPEDTCRSGQCIRFGQRCDGLSQCFDGSDENCPQRAFVFTTFIPPPVNIYYNTKGQSLDWSGSFIVQSRNASDTCPDTHFECQNQDCLPVYLRCNTIHDCPDHEDEPSTQCDQSTCPGFLRCRQSNVCVHPESVCDGVPHCPQRDDEMVCNQTCPHNCSCQGLAFICKSSFTFQSYPTLRYLHIESSILTTVDLSSNSYLVLLRLSNCQLNTLLTVKLGGLLNLLTLDLRENVLTSVELNTFDKLPNLRTLILSGNPLSVVTPFSKPNDKMKILDLSYTLFGTITDTTLKTFPRIQTLNLSNSAINIISNGGLNSTKELQYLDLRGTFLKSYPVNMLRHLSTLKHVWANDFKLCCKSALPDGFNPEQCEAPQDNIASCDGLLRSSTYRVCLWIIAVFALIGNAGSFVARLFLAKESTKSSFGLFVLNLSLSDFLMGVYLTMIGVADHMFRGQYWWRADVWKNSAACKTAGFLSLLSSEVSAFFICLITFDRFLVLRFPFSRFHFGHRSALVACCLAWFVGVMLAGAPLLSFASHWDFYGQTGICLPLPFSKRGTFPGYFYSFSVMIILNFVLFVFIALGQAFIYWSVRSRHNSKIRKNIKSSDIAIAQRLIAIVLSDFMCWFPTGVLGLLAFHGFDIHSEINITVAIFVMPFNAALNPFLYTLNLVMEKRRKAAEARLMLRFQASLRSQVSRQSRDTTLIQTVTCCQGVSMSPSGIAPGPLVKESALNQIDKWLKKGLLSKSDISSRYDASHE